MLLFAQCNAFTFGAGGGKIVDFRCLGEVANLGYGGLMVYDKSRHKLPEVMVTIAINFKVMAAPMGA
jgi:hypothetical protein